MTRRDLITQDVARNRLLSRLCADFTAILIGYNLPREDARRVAAQAVEPVQQYFSNSGTIFRVLRLRDLRQDDIAG
jgi:hypothetical protein